MKIIEIHPNALHGFSKIDGPSARFFGLFLQYSPIYAQISLKKANYRVFCPILTRFYRKIELSKKICDDFMMIEEDATRIEEDAANCSGKCPHNAT